MIDLSNLYYLADQAALQAAIVVKKGIGLELEDDAPTDPEKVDAMFNGMSMVAINIIAKLYPMVEDRKARKEVAKHIIEQSKVLYDNMQLAARIQHERAQSQIITPELESKPKGDEDA